MIIGLGKYTAGRLWIYDPENGTEEMTVPEGCSMRGYPQLKPGMS